MISSWLIYGMIVLGNLGFVCGLFGIGLFIAILFLGIMWIIEMDNCGEDDIIKGLQKKIKSIFIIAIIVWILAALCPNTKEMAAIYLIPKIANNQHIQQIPDKALNILEKYLDEWIKDQTKKEK